MQIIDQYEGKKFIYDRCAEKVLSLLKELLHVAGISVHLVSARVKTRPSLEKKIARKNGKYKSIDEITDIVGLRVVTFYEDDVDKVADVVESQFSIDRQNSIDKRLVHEPDRFGYLSLHYVASLSDRRAELGEYAALKDIKFEIQVRSLLQHAWAEIEHDLGYKSDKAIPLQFRRKFSRLASFLEGVDESFVEIRDGLAYYAEQVDSDSGYAFREMLLDKVTCLAVLKRDPVRKVDIDIANIFGLELEESGSSSFDFLINSADFLGLRTVGDLEDVVNKFSGIIPGLIRHIVNLGVERGDVFPFANIVPGLSVFWSAYILAYEAGGFEKLTAYGERNSFGLTDWFLQSVCDYLSSHGVEANQSP